MLRLLRQRDCDGQCVRKIPKPCQLLGNIIRWWSISIWIILILLFCFLKAHGSVAGQSASGLDPNFYVNQNSYTMGTVRAVAVVKPDARKTWTVVDFVPSFTPLLYPGDALMFCGNVSKDFEGLTSTDEVVIVYGRAIEVAKVGGPRPNVFACHSFHALRFVRKTDIQ